MRKKAGYSLHQGWINLKGLVMNMKTKIMKSKLLLIVSFGGLLTFALFTKLTQAQVVELPPGSGNLVRFARLIPADDPNAHPRFLDLVPTDEQGAIVAAFRAAFAVKKIDSALGLYVIDHNSGACGESSDRLVEQMRLTIPANWQVQQIRSASLQWGGGSAHQTTLLTSPNGNYYAIDVSMGYVQMVKLIPARVKDDDGKDTDGWTYLPGEEFYFSPYLANALIGGLTLGTTIPGNRSWLPSAGRSAQPGLCKVPKSEKTLKGFVGGALDPNIKIGSTGAGVAQYISGQEPLRYSIFFENLETATLPAQAVVITDQLDGTKMDLSTLTLGPIAFGNKITSPSVALSSYTTDVDLRPANNLIVRVSGQLDQNTGQLSWRFTSIDPATGQSTTDPLAGFLPPNKNSPEGQGSVVFTVMPKANLPTGTEIRNKGRIVFDRNAPIDTPEWLNTIDSSTPTSQVAPLPAQAGSTSFPLSWSGTDTGSGIASYTIYVSKNGSPYTAWLHNTGATSGMFAGEPNTNYAFYSVARDGAGNTENKAPAAEAGTMTPASTPTPTPTPTPAPRFTCPLGQGYWKNNPAAWKTDSLTLGGKTYTKTELLKILNNAAGSGKKTDASLILADQLIAAKLNLANGSDPAPVSSLIDRGDSLLSIYSGKLPFQTASSTAAGQAMVKIANGLETYNTGVMTPRCGSVSMLEVGTGEPTLLMRIVDIASFIFIVIASST